MFACTEPRSANQNLGRPTFSGSRFIRLFRHVTKNLSLQVLWNPYLQTVTPATPLECAFTKIAGCHSLNHPHSSSFTLAFFALAARSFRSLHKECFTTLLQSNASALFLKLPVYTNNSHFGSPRVSSRGTLLFALLLRPQHRYITFPLLTLTGLGTHGSQNTISVTCLLDRLPVPRTCILRTIGASLSLQQTFYGSPFLFFSFVGGRDG
jgi:hypothetical protein